MAAVMLCGVMLGGMEAGQGQGLSSAVVLLADPQRTDCFMPFRSVTGMLDTASNVCVCADCHLPCRPSGFLSPERLKQRSSRHRSSTKQHPQQQQQQRRPHSPLGGGQAQQEGYTSAADYLGGAASPQSPRWRDWYSDREGSSYGLSAVSSQVLAQGQRGHTSKQQGASASAGVQPRQPVPHFDAAYAPFGRYSTRAAAGSSAAEGGSNPGVLLEAGMALLRHGSSSGGKQGVQPSSTADHVLQHLLDEGIKQTPIGSKQHSRSRRHTRSSSGSSCRSSSPGGDASEGSSKSSSCNGRGSGGSRRSSSQSGRRNASEQQQLVEQQHKKDELVLLERSALQAARRAASPERMRRCSSPDVADAFVSAAAASAAAAGVAQWAQQRRAPGPALRSHSTSRCVRADCAAVLHQARAPTVAGVAAHVRRRPSLSVPHAVVVQLLLASPGFTRPAAGRRGAAGPAVHWMRQRSSSTRRACWSCLSPGVHALQV